MRRNVYFARCYWLWAVCLKLCLLATTANAETVGGDACVLSQTEVNVLATPDDWLPFELPGVGNAVSFSRESPGGLLVRGRNAGSGILWTRPVDMQQVKKLSWSVQIKVMPKQVDLTDKERDDSPLRISLVFSDDPNDFADLGASVARKRSMTEFFRPNSAMLVYAGVGADSANSPGPALESPYSERIRLVPWMAVAASPEHAYTTVSVNPRNDFARAFGRHAPRWAVLALICDTDNTGQRVKLRVRSVTLCLDETR